MTMTYTLGPTSETEVTVIPGNDFRDDETMNRSTIRTLSGKMFSYKWYDTKKINFSVNLLVNSDAAIVNSWWDSHSKLIFFESDGTTTLTTSVMIVNKSAPFAQFSPPYLSRYKGAIELEEYL